MWWLSSGWIWSLHSPVFNFSSLFFGYLTPRFSLWEQSTLPQSRFVTFLFCLPKKIKRINFHFKQKIHNPRPRSSSLNITQISPLSPHVTFFTTTQIKLTPSYYLNWLKLKSILTFITWVRYKIGTYNGRGLLVLVSKLTSPRVQKSWGSKLRDLREYLLLRFLARRDSKWLCWLASKYF